MIKVNQTNVNLPESHDLKQTFRGKTWEAKHDIFTNFKLKTFYMYIHDCNSFPSLWKPSNTPKPIPTQGYYNVHVGSYPCESKAPNSSISSSTDVCGRWPYNRGSPAGTGISCVPSSLETSTWWPQILEKGIIKALFMASFIRSCCSRQSNVN